MHMYDTPRLVIRPFSVQDADEAFGFMGDPEVARFTNWPPYSLSETRAELELLSVQLPAQPGKWNEYAIVVRSTQQVIGCVTCHLEDTISYQCEIGYFLNRSFQSQGYASKAVRGLISYTISSLRAHRVFAVADERNIGSIKLMERIGMQKEAHFRNNIFLKGEWNNEVIYAVLAFEWQANLSTAQKAFRSVAPQSAA